MANRETFPASQSPLQGDISGQAGDTTVKVVGLQTQPLSPTLPIDKDKLRYNASVPQWEPAPDGNASVTFGENVTTAGQIVSKGETVSDDYNFLCNNVSFDAIVGWAYGTASQVFLNGSPI
jgi:hypothetical protein